MSPVVVHDQPSRADASSSYPPSNEAGCGGTQIRGRTSQTPLAASHSTQLAVVRNLPTEPAEIPTLPGTESELKMTQGDDRPA